MAANLDGLARTAYLITWDEHEAEDLVQESLIKVARRWERVAAMQQPLAYTRRVLVNLALDGSGRRSRRRDELDRPVAAVGGRRDLATGGDRADLGLVGLRAELIEGVAALAPRQRAVVVLRYFVDLSEAETARALGCSVGTVKSTAASALARLRERLEPQNTSTGGRER